MTMATESDIYFRRLTLFVFLAVIWAVYLLDPGDWAYRYGVRPRDQAALFGIVAMPFLHANFLHVGVNTTALLINLYQKAAVPWMSFWPFLVVTSLASGGLIWWLHPDTAGAPLVGASALVFAILGHGLATSIRNEDMIGPLFLAAQVIVLWPLWKVMMLPGPHDLVLFGERIDIGNVSWVGHWIGAGVGAAYAMLLND